MGRNNIYEAGKEALDDLTHNPSWGEITDTLLNEPEGLVKLITPHGEK